MNTPNASTIVEVATSLQANHTKLELVALARSFGWRGDHARAPMLQLALFVATKLAAGERAEQPHDSRNKQADQEQAEAAAKAEAARRDQEQAEAAAKAEATRRDQEQAEAARAEAAAKAEAARAEAAAKAEAARAEAAAKAENASKGGQDMAEESKAAPGAPEVPSQDSSDEFDALLKASGITTPHRMLEKVWRLTAKGRMNVMLVGPAASGKTMLAEQVAQLMRVPFASLSCTMGMSESQLTGWLLPVGEGGRFDYVAAPFVKCLSQPSVFLLDEMDAGDPNALMIMNSVASNGFLTIPHKLENPTVQRHTDSILIAGCNTVGAGADAMYSARSALDGATLDRFYTLEIGYDEAYESSLFSLDGRKSKRSKGWKPSTVPVTGELLTECRDWFFTLRSKVTAKRLDKIISSRMAQRLVAAIKAGIPLAEVKADLMLGWTADEKARVGEAA